MDEWENSGILSVWVNLAVGAAFAVYVCQSTVVWE